MNNVISVDGLPKLNSTPLASIVIDSPSVTLEADDDNEVRRKIIFEPYQAVRVTTFDCYLLPKEVPLLQQTIMEIEDSTWIKELRSALELTDSSASFMDKARHFLLPLQEDFLEIVALDVKLKN